MSPWGSLGARSGSGVLTSTPASVLLNVVCLASYESVHRLARQSSPRCVVRTDCVPRRLGNLLVDYERHFLITYLDIARDDLCSIEMVPSSDGITPMRAALDARRSA